MFSKTIERLNRPASMRIASLAKKLKAGGHDILDLTLGQPDLPVHYNIIESVHECLLSGKTGYTESQGILELREQISVYESEKWGYPISADQVLVSPGGKQAIYYALRTLVNPLDEVIIIEPCWLSYKELIEMVGGKAVILNTDPNKNFVVSIHEILAKITSKTKAIILNVPNNPTGSIYPSDTIKMLIRYSAAHQIFLIFDNIYDEIIFDDEKIEYSLEPLQCEKLIIVNGFSKSFSMTGFRVGYVISHEIIMEQMIKVHEQLATCTSIVSQYAALAALRIEKSYLEKRKEVFERRRDFVVNRCRELNIDLIVPQGGIYCLIDTRSINSSSVVAAEKILQHALVAVIPGVVYGISSEGYVRISLVGDEAILEEALKRISDLMELTL
ncbi:aspartate aminotransferase [Paenibacillus montaniterrae]|uniref:Aminotransferase n=1 Tax=Paenibacillus montaniterrae TaxID=429341 RepID=A0A919YV70_9BACL|nr:aminotransferase class I/II-fold pyridoxal phosphate-dependent enzyme [Paenibacillus montaniterrae]GIP19111.1 aspartate aminotransferase [Paenibacillus montaniterrae]